MTSKSASELENFPKYKAMYIRAFDKLLKQKAEKGKINKYAFKNGTDFYNWWVGLVKYDDFDPDQFSFEFQEDFTEYVNE